MGRYHHQLTILHGKQPELQRRKAQATFDLTPGSDSSTSNPAACLAADLNARGSKTRRIVQNMWYHPERNVDLELERRRTHVPKAKRL